MDTRDRIVRSAATLFLTRSYRSVGVADLCAAADVRKGSFYHFFPTKSDLAKAVVDLHAAELERRLAGTGNPDQNGPASQTANQTAGPARTEPEASAGAGAGAGARAGASAGAATPADPAARLYAIADAITGIHTAFERRFGRVVGCPFGNLAAELSTTDDELRAHVAGVLARWERTLADACRAAAPALRSTVDPEALAHAILAQIQGLILLAKVGGAPAADITAGLHTFIAATLREPA